MAPKAGGDAAKVNSSVYKDKSKPADIRLSNINAAKAVSDAIRTSLGPRGMDKMIQAANGEVTITNDGATILKQISVIHPAAKMLLRNHLFNLLEDVPVREDFPLTNREEMIFQHGGCPAHYRASVRQWLDETFPLRWIGRGGPTPWPARCPDLTPCDYYLWGHIKTLVYTTPVNNVEELKARIIAAANQIQQDLTGVVTRSNLRKRLRACIRNQGGQIEQDLK